MKLKYLWIFAAATIGFAACSSDDDEEPAVGVTAATITPAGSSVTYNLSAAEVGVLDNKSDSVAWDVTDAALSEAVLKVTPTLNTVVSVNGTEITSEGVVVNANQPIVLTATGSGITKTVTINVFRAVTAAEGLTKKATLATTNVVWRDVTYWKGKFYAFTVTNTVTDAAAGTSLEEYKLSSSTDGVTWADIDYKVTNVENEVIGGEGARLLAQGDKLYIFNGMRTLGTDKYGNEAEIENGWFGPSPTIAKWRGFVTTDGQNFTSLEEQASVSRQGTALGLAVLKMYNNPYGTAVVFKDQLFLIGGYTISFSMTQTARNILTSTDGTTWSILAPVDAEGASVVLPFLGSEVFVLNNKLYLIAGFGNFVSDSQNSIAVYSSEDGTVWKNEGTLEGIGNIYQGRVVSNGSVAYLVGGETLGEDGATRVINNKVYRSTDAINWTEVTTPAAFAGSRYPSAVAVGNAAWFFGGAAEVSTGSYAAPTGTEAYSGDVWNTQFK